MTRKKAERDLGPFARYGAGTITWMLASVSANTCTLHARTSSRGCSQEARISDRLIHARL